MFIKNYTSCFSITGKLSLTPTEAFEMFGYRMKPGAKGIVLQRRNGKTFIRSLMPQDHRFTKNRQHNKSKMKIISTIASQHMDDLIYPAWDPLAQELKYPSGFTLFVGTNMHITGCPPDWHKLVITQGPLPLPEVLAVTRHRSQLTLQLRQPTPKLQLGIAFFSPRTHAFFHFPGGIPQSCGMSEVN